jgi:hypothetical protein
MDSSSTKNHWPETEKAEEPDGSSKKLRRFIWSSQLHEKFLRAVEVLGECKAICIYHISVICYV